MNNWNVGTRIAAGFAVVIAIAAALGIFAYSKVGDIEASSEQVITKEMPKLALAGALEKNVERTFSLALQHATASNTQEMAEVEAELQAVHAANNTDVADFEKLIHTEKGHALNEVVKAARAAYWESLTEMLKTSRMGTAEANQRALAMTMTQVLPLQKKYQEATENIVEQNKVLAEAAGVAVEASVASARMGILTVLGIAVLIAICICVFVVRSITRPLAVALELVEHVSGGDLTHSVEVTTKDELGRMLLALNRMMENLRTTVRDVNAAAGNVASGSEQMSATAQTLSQGSTEQAASAEETTSSMQEMSASVQQNADNARQTDKIASTAADDAKASGDAVARTLQAMKEVAGKINIIEEIARKTDLLALNAAVEAARAGEHGRGFAVVASEVRKLAERSQTAAAEISHLTIDGVKTAESAGQLLTKLVPDIRKTAELVREIAAASGEQSTGAMQINKAIQQLDQVIQQNASASQEMAATSEELASQADVLQSAIGFFKLEDGQRARAPQSAKAAAPVRRKLQATRPGKPQSTSADLASMDRAIKSPGPSIELGSNTGNADARDRDFAVYHE